MSSRPLTTTQDPALSANTFLSNKTLSASLSRLSSRYAAQPLGTMAMVIADQPDELTIGMEYPDGHSTIRAFVAPDVVTARSVISGAEVDGDDAHDPFADSAPSEMTNSETNRHYLAMHDWQPVDGAGELWRDEIGGGIHRIAVAVQMENMRAQRDALADNLSFEDTPLAELYDGE